MTVTIQGTLVLTVYAQADSLVAALSCAWSVLHGGR
jgi:hypothetical protein